MRKTILRTPQVTRNILLVSSTFNYFELQISLSIYIRIEDNRNTKEFIILLRYIFIFFHIGIIFLFYEKHTTIGRLAAAMWIISKAILSLPSSPGQKKKFWSQIEIWVDLNKSGQIPDSNPCASLFLHPLLHPLLFCACVSWRNFSQMIHFFLNLSDGYFFFINEVSMFLCIVVSDIFYLNLMFVA